MNMRFLVTLLFFVNIIHGNSHNYYVIDGTHEDNSVIKIWYTVLGLLDDYDNSRCAGFEISFNENGKHYDKNRGPNWWEYYFTFNSIGTLKQGSVKRVPRYQRSIIRFKTACTMSPERAYFLLNKYVKIQPKIEAKLDHLKQEYLTHDTPIVGVYYQKPIMSEVQQSWDPLALCEHVKKEIKDLGDCKVCLFTDQVGFTAIFEEQFEKEFISIPSLKNNENTSQAERGEHELLTLLLLAECNLVIAPGSYQSIGAKMLNPALKLIELDVFPYAFE